jgi:autotransporter-associated beta strand protein
MLACTLFKSESLALHRWFGLLSICAVIFFPVLGQAGNTWTGGGGSPFNWSTNANWGGAAPAYGTITFSGSVGTVNTLNGNFTSNGDAHMNQVSYTGSSTWTMNVANSTVLSLFDNGGTQAKVENNSSGLVTINAPITFAANNGSPPNPFGEINAVSADFTFGSGTLTVNGSSVNGIKLFGGSHTINFNNTVSASGKWFGHTTSGTGNTINIGGSFTSGDFYVMNGGTVNLNSGGTFSPSAVRLGGDFGTTGNQDLTKSGTFNLAAPAGSQTYSGVINSASLNTSGTLAVNSQNTSGTNTLSGHIALDSALKITQSAGGTLNITQTKGGDTTTGTDIKGQTLTLTPAATGNINHGGTIYMSTGSGSIVMNGAGTTTLSGTTDNPNLTATVSAGTLVLGKTSSSVVHALGGGTDVINSGGTLQLGGSGGDQIYDATAVTVNSGGAFDLNGQSETISSISLNGAGIGGTGALTNNSSSAATLTLTNASTLAGATTMGGTGDITISGAGAITASSATTVTKVGSNKLTLSNGGSVDNLNFILAVSAGTVVLNKTGTTQSPSVHAIGGLTINGGTVQLSGSGGYEIYDGATPTVNSGGVLDMNGQNQTFTSAGPTISGTGISSGGTLINSSGTASTITGALILGADSSAGGSGNLTISGVVSGSGKALTKVGAGTLTLSAANTYSGNTTVSAGTLALSGSGSITNTPTITLAQGATISTSGRSDGTLALAVGQTLKGNGIVVGTLAVATNSTLAPGSSVGALTNLGTVLLQSGGTNVVEVINATNIPGAGFDLLSVTGDLGVQATAGSPFTFKLVSFNGSSTAGAVTNFSKDTNYSWTIATVGGNITNFNTNALVLDNSAFSNDLGGGVFFLSTNAGALSVRFTNNHPPLATNASFTVSPGLPVRIRIADLITNYTGDADGDGVLLMGLGAGTNGAAISTNSTYIFYTPTNNLSDSFTYTVRDNRSYRTGDTVRTAQALIQIVAGNTYGSWTGITNGSGNVTLSFSGIPGYTYVVQWSPDMAAWTDVATNALAFPGNGQFSFTTNNPPSPSFFRTRSGI